MIEVRRPTNGAPVAIRAGINPRGHTLNRNRSLRRGGDGADEPELGNLTGQSSSVALWRSTSEVFGAEVLVEGAVSQHVVGGGQDRGGDGTYRLLGSAPVPQASELRLQVAFVLAAGRPGTLHEGGLQPSRPLTQPGGASLARTLVVARA